MLKMSADKKTYSNVCRSCMSDRTIVTSIFTMDTTLAVSYKEIFSSVTGIEIKPNDKLTTLICPACKHNVKAAYQYIKQAQRSDKWLRDALASYSTSEAPEQKGEYEKVKVKQEQYIEISVKPEAKMEVEDEFYDDFIATSDDFSYDGQRNTMETEHCFSNGVTLPKKEKSNYCPVCNEKFADAFSLLEHARSHRLMPTRSASSYKQDTRQWCDFKIPNAVKVKISAVTNKASLRHSEDDDYSQDGEIVNELAYVLDPPKRSICGICGRRSQSRSKLEEHYSELHGYTSVTQCVNCDKWYLEPIYLRRHLEHAHGQETGALYATTAKIETVTFDILMQRLNKTSAFKDFVLTVCSQCGEVSFSKMHRNQHNKNVHPDFTYHCNGCLKVFNHPSAMSKHTKSCVKQIFNNFLKKGQLKCDICDEKFGNGSLLYAHKLSEHPKATCNICNITFRRWSTMENHKYREHGPKVDGKAIFQCDMCNYSTNNKTNLGKHMQTHIPLSERPMEYLCRFCGYAARQSGNLSLHVRRFHSMEKPHKCSICDMAFARKADCSVHEMRHRGEKPLACQYCSRRFTTHHELKKHTHTHLGVKPYACRHCDRRFTQSNDMRRHERTHGGGNREGYDCQCGQAFSKAKQLQDHRRTCVGFAPGQDLILEDIKQQMSSARNYSHS